MSATLNRQGNGFTLVELLVVLGILGLLLSLVMPAVNRAIGRGRAATCISNLRSMGQGLALYAADHQGRLVDGAAFYGNEFWFHRLEPYLGEIDYDTQSLNRPDWQLCPAKRVPIDTNHTVGYGWNSLFLDFSVQWFEAEDLTERLPHLYRKYKDSD